MAFDAFLKIDGIDGESQDKTHPNEIEIDSFSWGVTERPCRRTSTSRPGSARPRRT